jgi:hypothetical protein
MSTRTMFGAAISRLAPGLLFAFLILGSDPLSAERSRQSAPANDSDGPAVRVERASPPASTSRAGGSRGSGSTRVSDAGRTRPPASGGSSGAPTRVESRRGGSHGGHYGHHGYGRHYYPRFSFHYGYPYWGWYWGPYASWYWPWWWDRPYGGYGYGSPGYGRSEDALGALDLDLAPERAEVYVDGERIGLADDFDGFPTYLWLPRGTYDLVFYRDGYETIARQYSVYPGVVIDVEDRMVPGDSVRPEDLASKSTVNRDERLRRDRERAAEAPGRRPYRPEAAPEEPYDVRGEPGRVALQVLPEDASVYLDGRFVGTGGELARLHAGLIVDPGSHRLEVVRPGYDTQETQFEVEAGEEVTVEVDLEREGR